MDGENESGSFPRTRWTLVEEVRGGGADGERALGELCGMYWYPVYAFLRRSGAGAEDAEDLAQGFFAKLLEKGLLGAADAGKGKLRTFLLTALKRFQVSEFRKGLALKRGGGVVVVSVDAREGEERFRDEPAELEDPEVLFERRWALGLLDEALGRVEAEYAGSGKVGVFAALSPSLAGREGGEGYAEMGEVLGMSAGAVQVAVYRMRKRLRRHFEAVVGETVEGEEEIEEEVRHVLRVISG